MKKNGSKVIPIKVNAFFSPKLGNKPVEYEDSFNYDLAKGIFAVADGASESCFAKLWANLLTRSFVESKRSLFSIQPFTLQNIQDFIESFVSPIQKEWNQMINWDSLPWNIEEKAKKGAFATFLGLELNADIHENHVDLRGIAVGDCCLFYEDTKKSIKSFPISSSSQFGNIPYMLSSRLLSNISIRNFFSVFEGKIETGQLLLLASDALSKWILQQLESGAEIWKFVNLEKETLKDFIEDLINDKKMRNEDTTLLRIQILD